MLIERGAPLDGFVNGAKKSPLHVAIINQFTECARLLIQNGCDVNLQVNKDLYREIFQYLKPFFSGLFQWENSAHGCLSLWKDSGDYRDADFFRQD